MYKFVPLTLLNFFILKKGWQNANLNPRGTLLGIKFPPHLQMTGLHQTQCKPVGKPAEQKKAACFQAAF